MNRYNTFKSKREFNAFLSNIPKYLKEITNYILNTHHLCFNEEEVIKLSTYFIGKKDNYQFTSNDRLLFIAYLGEYIIKNYGGEWFFTGNKDAFTPNEPSIGNSQATLLRESPSDSIYNIFEKREIDYFPKHLKKNIEKKMNINDVFNELFPKKKK